MMTSSEKQNITEQLINLCNEIKDVHLRDLFMHDKDRAKKLSCEFSELFIDYSKNIISAEILDLLFQYAEAENIQTSINAMFDGKKINTSENRAVLHTALRSSDTQKLEVDNVNIIEKIHTELEKIGNFVANIHDGKHTGWTDKPIDTFVNIGIGGSDFGPKMAVDALSEYRCANTRSFFISNIDYESIQDLQNKIDPETTLFIISSKSFTTLETLRNAETLKHWMTDSGCTQLNKHFFAVTSNLQAAKDNGIDSENIFQIWDWVGGRFSLWSAMGLPIALAIGFKNFSDLLTGAREMDEHFLHTPIENNIPIILALIDYWYRTFLNTETHAIIPYDESLKLFPEYLTQLFMESNGKSFDVNGNKIEYKTMPIVWGSTGTNSQHAYFQLLHQGTQLIPVDFLAPLSKKGNETHHALLFANCIAQSQALMLGEENSDSYKNLPGNKPSTTILYSELTPKTLGSLLAIYEHRAFVQGLLWHINSFDQWGVELGKKLTSNVFDNLNSMEFDNTLDASTKELVKRFKKANK